MIEHQNLMRDVLETGELKTDRTGTGTISKFGGMQKFSLQHGFWPIPTSRRIDHEKISSELEWMLRGIVSVQWLKDQGNGIWNSWMGEKSGTIGPMYGEQWRNYGAAVSNIEGEDEKRLLELLEEAYNESYVGGHRYDFTSGNALDAMKKFVKEKTKLYQDGGRGGFDQIQYLIDELKNNPDSRRLVVNVWHAGLLPNLEHSPKENADNGRMALAPCHSTWQVTTSAMSDMDILREIAYRHEDFAPQVEKMIKYNCHMTSVDLARQIKMVATVWLYNKTFIRSTITLPSLSVVDVLHDDSFEIKPAGQELIEEYKEAGKPVRKLSLLCFARSQDVPLGTVFNVGMYSQLAHILATMTNMVPWEYTHFMGDYHIYSNQVPFVKEQLKRTPMPSARIIIDPSIRKIEDYDYRNVQVFYEAHEKIVYPRAAV